MEVVKDMRKVRLWRQEGVNREGVVGRTKVEKR